MKLIKNKNRELLYLYLVLLFAITLAIFSVSLRFIEKLYSFFETYTSLPVTDFIINFVFFYLSGLILLLYRRWREAAKRQAELEMEDTMRIKDLAINSSINGIGIADIEGHLIYVNQCFLKMWGYDEKEVLGKHLLKFCQKEDEVVEAIEDEGWIGEMKARRKNGSLFDVLFSASMVKDKNNTPICMMASFIDITRRKQAEEALLKSSETRFRTLIQKSADGVLVTDKKGIVRFVNPAAESLFGRKEKELLGEIFGFPIVTGETAGLAVPHDDKEPTIVDMRVVETEWEGEGAYLLSLRDVTARKRYEESLIKTTEELKKLDQMKSDFVSVASHELRTPLASIKNAVDLILSRKTGDITDAQEKFLSMAQRNVNRLSALINDLLDISRIESGKIQL
jgi:PAS domain S-box-containing protein